MSSVREIGQPSDFYAPRFVVKVEGQPLSAEQVADVLTCKVTTDINNLTSFDLAINNWDPETLALKYVDTDKFFVGKRISIAMGYADELVEMMTGLITSMTPRFPESGPPSMSVAGQDDMIRLKGRKPGPNDRKRFPLMHDWEIAQEIARRNNLECVVTKEGPQHVEVIQKNQDDATFLMERAKRIDFDCFIRTDIEKNESVLHFTKPKDKRDGSALKAWVFNWGENLIEFSPRLTIAHQVAKVTVRGWDAMKKEVIEFTADASKLPNAGEGGTTGPELVARALGGKQDMVVDAPVQSQEEAEKLAVSLLTEKAYGFVTGSGRCIGLPEMRPGDLIEIGGLGTRFSGNYYVTKVDHTIGTSGYFTSFEVRRTHGGAGKAS